MIRDFGRSSEVKAGLSSDHVSDVSCPHSRYLNRTGTQLVYKT